MRAVREFRTYSLRKKILLIAGITALVLLFISLITFAWFARDISDRERLMNRNNTGIRMVDKDGQSFYTFGRVKEQADVPLADISDNLEKALVASEDKDFYEHSGYSIRSIGGAVLANVFNQDATAYGGSTITQQLVKNNLLTSNKSFLRKYQELSIAIAVDRNYTKEEILEMYLNSVYYGEGAFGIGPAAKAYFNKTPGELTLAESSMLIGILPAPSAYSPISGDVTRAEAQQKRVLGQMVEEKYISAETAAAAEAEAMTYASGLAATNTHAQHFAEMVVDELNERYGEERVARSGYQVTTTLALEWQKSAEQQVRARVAQLAGQGGRNAGLVAIDPRSGAIRALVGSADWNNEQFGKVNMALQERQPGSSFKPIYYTEAMAQRLITPATTLHDSAKTFGTYKPQNYDFKFQGDMTTRRALAQSRNLTAIEVMEKLGIDESIDAAQRMGIKGIDRNPDEYGLALALGTAEASLLDMTNAYAAFANAGQQYEPVSILSIKDKFGKLIYEHEAEAKEVQSAEASYLISSIMSDPLARAPTFSSLNIPGRTVAVKTGTTNDNKDAWTIGYSPSVAVGVWLGNNENVAMSGVAGASGAGPIWKNSMQRFLADTPVENFTKPADVQQILVCANGQRASRAGNGTYNEYFIRGTYPSGSCNVPKPEEKKEDKKDNSGPSNTDDDRKPAEEDDDNPTVTPTPPTTVAKQCSDGKDNDGDGEEDLDDPDCTSLTDDSEAGTVTPTPPPTSPTPAPTPAPVSPTPAPTPGR